MNQWKSAHAVETDARTLADALRGADALFGLSAKGARDPGHGQEHGAAADRVRHGQPRPRDHAGSGQGGAARCDHRDRALRLPQPGQQRAGLSLHLPRRPRRARHDHQRRHEDRGGLRDRGARPGGRAGRGERGLSRAPPALWPPLSDPDAVRPAPDHRGATCGRRGCGRQRRGASADRRSASATATRCARGSIRPRAACR